MIQEFGLRIALIRIQPFFFCKTTHTHTYEPNEYSYQRKSIRVNERQIPFNSRKWSSYSTLLVSHFLLSGYLWLIWLDDSVPCPPLFVLRSLFRYYEQDRESCVFDGTAQRLNITFINTILIIYACAPARPRARAYICYTEMRKEWKKENQRMRTSTQRILCRQ